MKDITELLKQKDKMTSAHIAAQLKKPAREVIASLLHLERGGDVTQLNGFWFIAKEKKESIQLSDQVLGIIQQWGYVSASEVAFITGARLSVITRVLSEHVMAGKVIRYRKSTTHLYSLVPEPESTLAGSNEKMG